MFTIGSSYQLYNQNALLGIVTPFSGIFHMELFRINKNISLTITRKGAIPKDSYLRETLGYTRFHTKAR